MKKVLAILLAAVMVLSFAACGEKEPKVDYTKKSEGVMTYAQFAAAAIDAEVTVEAFVQAHQSWWDNKVTVYAADPDGGYFFYELACSEADAAKLVPGTKIKVSGYKASWKGEVEITDATFEFCNEADNGYIAQPTDATAWLGTDELEKHVNELVTFKGVEVVEMSKKESESDPDIYLTVKLGDASYSLCVENYLNGPSTDVYKAVEALKAGDKIDVTGFNYWYEGPNMHITAVAASK